MENATGNPAEQEKALILWGYVLQWGTLVMPPALLVSLIYVLVVRKRVSSDWLVSHIRWQLATCIIVAAAIPVAFGLLFTGFAGVATDAPISIVATFALLGGASAFPLWLLYRLGWGTIKYFQDAPMRTNPYL